MGVQAWLYRLQKCVHKFTDLRFMAINFTFGVCDDFWGRKSQNGARERSTTFQSGCGSIFAFSGKEEKVPMLSCGTFVYNLPMMLGEGRILS